MSSNHLAQTSHDQTNCLNKSIYNPPNELHLNTKFWWEAFGMFFLIFLICCVKPAIGFDLWISSVLPVAIMLSVKQSGAHYNPSMTISNFLIKFNPSKIDFNFIWTYFKADFVPAFLAFNIGFYFKGYYYPPLAPKTLLESYQIVVSEVIGTFMLVVLLQKVVNSQTTFTKSDIETFTFVVFTVYIARKFAVLSGNSINPVALLACAFAAVLQCNFSGVKSSYLYLLGDLIGSVIGSYFYNWVLEPAIRKSRQQKQKERTQNSLCQIINQIKQQQMGRIGKLTEIAHRSHVQSEKNTQDLIKQMEGYQMKYKRYEMPKQKDAYAQRQDQIQLQYEYQIRISSMFELNSQKGLKQMKKEKKMEKIGQKKDYHQPKNEKVQQQQQCKEDVQNK